MMFSGNPLEASWSTKKKLYFLFYLVFLLSSVWASGHSVARTLNNHIPKYFCFVLALAALATASFCLTLIKESSSRTNTYISNRSTLQLFGIPGFIFLWFIVLMANTHNIYYVMIIDNQRQQELRNVKNQLDLVKDKSVAAFNVAKAKFSSNIEADIKNIKDEIQNPNNPGYGEATSRIVTRVEQKLGQNIEMPTNQPTDFSKRRQYAESMATKIREMTQEKLSTIDHKIQQLNTFVEQQDYKNTQKTVEELINKFHNKNEEEITQGLRDSYSIYKKSQEYIDQLFAEPLIKDNTDLLIQKLPETPVSIELENVAYCWKEFFKSGNVNNAEFIWAILAAFILDLACFLFWYFGVLSEE